MLDRLDGSTRRPPPVGRGHGRRWPYSRWIGRLRLPALTYHGRQQSDVASCTVLQQFPI